MMKILMSVGIYVSLVAVLGVALAMMGPRGGVEVEPPDDES